MGFEFDLAKAFSQYLGVQLKVKTVEWDQIFSALNKGDGDFLAAGVTITQSRSKKVSFSNPYMTVQQQVIVHRKNRSINELEDLQNASVHIRPQTTYQNRLEELNKEKGLNLKLVLYKNMPTEELIQMVSQERIPITVADSNIALLNRKYYPDIRIAFPLSEEQYLGWAVTTGNFSLLEEINKFFAKIEEDGTYGKIYEEYYGKVHIFDYLDLKKFHQRLKTRLPKYINPIMHYANKYGFDCRLIAAVTYQESHLNPRAHSYTGVRGLMQVTQTTAKEMGIQNRLDPVQSIQAGIKYLRQLYNRWKDISGKDKLYFALASYNIGYGHVQDARSLAKEQGLDPNKWSSLKQCLPLLRKKKYYQKTKHGYARGTEPVRYVRRIKTYYDILKQKEFYPEFVRQYQG